MEEPERHREYWRRNLRITTVLLTVWFLVTYVATFFARELNEITFIGFPLGFYMAAQGALVIYLAIIWFYDRYMDRLDRRYGDPDQQDRSGR